MKKTYPIALTVMAIPVLILYLAGGLTFLAFLLIVGLEALICVPFAKRIDSTPKEIFYQRARKSYWGFVAMFGFLAFFAFTLPQGSLGLGLLFVAPIGIGFYYFYIRKQPDFSSAGQLTEHGSSMWNSREELEALAGDNGIYIGGGWILKDPEAMLIAFGPPGSGKTSGILIPNLLIRPAGSYFVTDPKGEITCITARAQAEYGQKVVILDPWNVQKEIGARHGIEASGFNPFEYLRANMDELLDLSEMIAHILIPQDINKHQQFWDERARSLIKLLLAHIVTYLPQEKQNFWTLYKMLRTDNDQFAELIVDMKLNSAFDGFIQAGANEIFGLLQTAPETYGGIRSNAQNGTKIFESPQLRKSLETSGYDPRWMTDGNTAVYVVIPERYRLSHSAWLKIVLGLTLKAVNHKPDKRAIFLIDECANLGKMQEIIDGYAIGRGANMTLFTFFQDLSQLKEVYGENAANGLLSKSKVREFMDQQDFVSQKYVSDLLGRTTILQKSDSFNEQGSSTSYTPTGRDLLTPEEVGKIQQIITFIADKKFLLPKTMYYRDYGDGWHEIFREKADPPPRVNV